MKYQNDQNVQNETVARKNNVIAIIFKVLAVCIFIGGIIAAIVVGSKSGGIAFLYLAVCLVSGLFNWGFAEIIQLLQDIKNK